MAADEKWYFTKEQLTNTPSRRCGIDADKELSYRQQAANFIQDMGQRLVVSQLCINTAIVYMHRFYVFHSLSQFHRNAIATAALFLAAKVEEQPRKLEHVIKMAHMCLHRDQPPPDIRSEQYLEQAQDLVFNENVLLQTLGFDVAIDHPHTHVVRCCQLVKASKDLAQTSYFMASNSLHLTTMCLQYKPTVVACFCIHLACKWSNWEIPQSNEGKHWFWYVDKTVTSELLQQLTAEFLHIFDKCPSRLKRKIMSISANQSPSMNHPSLPNSPFDAEPRKVQSPATASDGSGPTFHSNRSHHTDKQDEKKASSSIPTRPPVDYREYREKKERERLEREKAAGGTAGTVAVDQNRLSDVNKHHSHHHKPGGNVANKHSMAPGHKTTFHHNHHRTSASTTTPASAASAELKQSTGQSVPGQRHATNSQQPRDPNREANRPRLPSSMHAHGIGYGAHQTLKETSGDIGSMQESTSHGNIQEKLGSNNHGTVHKMNVIGDGKHQSHDKRAYDPRHKISISEHNRKDAEQKIYSNKYSDAQSRQVQGQRKLDTLEQRSEEVRKLIEKPLPSLKQPTLHGQHGIPNNAPIDVQKQPHHHGKYPQLDKTQQNNIGASVTGDIKPPMNIPSNVYPHDHQSPTTPGSTVVGSLQTQHKSMSSKFPSNQLSAHGLPQMSKDAIKNGNSQQSVFAPLNNVPDDQKIDKRLRNDDQTERSPNLQQNSLQTPPGRHKSLFSPEKVSVSRDVHSQRATKSKQKTPPISSKVPKQERPSDVSTGLSLLSPFASPTQQVQQQYESSSLKRVPSDLTNVSHKRHRTSSVSDVEQQQIRVKAEDSAGFDTMKMIGRVPEMIQPIRDNPSSIDGAKNNSLGIDSKLPETIKPYESDLAARQRQTSQHGSLSNGFNVVPVKQEPQDYLMKPEAEVQIKTEAGIVKSEYTTSMKTAQSISALLQEPLAPMPSLLQGMQQFSHVTQQQPQQVEQRQQELEQQRSLPHTLLQSDYRIPVQSQCLPMLSTVTVDNSLPVSTVDTNALVVPAQSTSETLMSVPTSMSTGNVQPTTGPAATMAMPVAEKQKPERHKSEKKKKEKKHKHKDKDKSKEKHKHKHKDKDKEKHRDKDKEKEKEKEKNEEAPGPIKITIPKDKLNLSTEGAAPNTPSSGLKIKIPKERLKAAGGPTSTVTASENPATGAQPLQVMQAPLKIKISRGGAQGITPSVGSNEPANESRKRDRADMFNESSTSSAGAAAGVGPPPNKKQLQAVTTTPMTMGFTGAGQYHHRPTERQNGRHYSGTNNKEKHSAGHHRSSSKLSQSQQLHTT